jgi:lauroyl/myristoyl acyltransferase
MHRYPMETVEVTMFGKSARIHNGVFRMGETFGAVLLPFYLRFARGRFERVCSILFRSTRLNRRSVSPAISKRP